MQRENQRTEQRDLDSLEGHLARVESSMKKLTIYSKGINLKQPQLTGVEATDQDCTMLLLHNMILYSLKEHMDEMVRVKVALNVPIRLDALLYCCTVMF